MNKKIMVEFRVPFEKDKKPEIYQGGESLHEPETELKTMLTMMVEGVDDAERKQKFEDILEQGFDAIEQKGITSEQAEAIAGHDEELDALAALLRVGLTDAQRRAFRDVASFSVSILAKRI